MIATRCSRNPWTTVCLLLGALLILTDAAAATDANRPQRPPNIVLFLADDLGWADVTWHGSTDAMPNLDRLARSGTRLEAHYVHPMCSPTRAALLTGRYASRFGVTAAQNQQALPFGTQTLASLLQSAGYDTALIGKWHLGSKGEWGPAHFGFDFGYGSLAGGVGPFNHRYKRGEFSHTWHRNGQLIEEEGHVTDLIAEQAVNWVQQRSDRPFFLYVPFTAIHVPIEEPEQWHEANAHLSDPAKRLRAACTTHMDNAVGRVLKAVDEMGATSDTLVIFLSDNGAHPPSDNQGGPYPGEYERLKVGNDNHPLRGHKTTVYEGGIRTPGIVSWPGEIPIRDVQTPLHAVDWLPTLCALAGVEVPASLKLDGVNIWPVLTGATQLPDRSLYSAGVRYRAQMVRHGDWKLVVTRDKQDPDGSPPKLELFDLRRDPSESSNLATAQPEILQQMQTRLQQVSASDNDARVPRKK